MRRVSHAVYLVGLPYWQHIKEGVEELHVSRAIRDGKLQSGERRRRRLKSEMRNRRLRELAPLITWLPTALPGVQSWLLRS